VLLLKTGKLPSPNENQDQTDRQMTNGGVEVIGIRFGHFEKLPTTERGLIMLDSCRHIDPAIADPNSCSISVRSGNFPMKYPNMMCSKSQR
jgi:hypothetical protein